MKLDYLFIGAHPDDCEISCAGTILHFKELGKMVGIIDLSDGELGTYGSKEERDREKARADELMGLDYRGSLNLGDGFIKVSDENRLALVEAIRELQPEMVFTFQTDLRHPDHHHTGRLVKESVFLSGVANYGNDRAEGGVSKYQPVRPLLSYFDEPVSEIGNPNYIIDISKHFERKVEVIKAYSTQVKVETDHPNTQEDEPRTMIKSDQFWRALKAKNAWYGVQVGGQYGEGFFCDRPLRVEDPLAHLSQKYR